MNRRNVLFGLLAGFVALFIPTKAKATYDITCDGHKKALIRHQAYSWTEMDSAKELTSILQDALYAKQIQSYAVEYDKERILIRWCGLDPFPWRN